MLRLRMLGECVIELEGSEYGPSATHFFALLLRLGTEAGRYFQRDELARLLYPAGKDVGAAAHSVRQLVYLAQQRGARISRLKGAIGIATDACSNDLDELLQRDQGVVGPELRVLTVLGGYTPSISAEYSAWLDGYREYRASQLRHALIAAIDAHRLRAEWQLVEARARECLLVDPLSESATLALAEALARTGSKERALAMLDGYARDVGATDERLALPALLLRKRVEHRESIGRAHDDGPLQGRGEEMASIQEQWALARAGTPQCTVIRGEAGSGKTRLIDEYRAVLELAGGCNLAVVRNSVAERFRPFAFVADLVPRLLQLPGAAGCDPDLLPFLHRLMTPTAAAPSPFSTPGEAQFIDMGIKRAVRDLFESLCGERPCVVLVDDSRAIDDLSLALLTELSATSPLLQLHVVIACADSEPREMLAFAMSRTLLLPPLARESARALASAHLAVTRRPLAEDAIEWCISLAAGNPAFLHLLLSECERSGALDVPQNIVAAVDRRIGMLSPAAQRTLEACAVLGDHCDAMILGEVVGLEPFVLLSVLHELERGGLIVHNGERILLRSMLFHDRSVQGAGGSVLSLLHARCATALAARPASAGSSWRIASHWRSAGQRKRARETLTASWRSSLQLGQPAHAEASIREFLSLTTDPAERVELYDDLIEVTQVLGKRQATISAIDERTQTVLHSGMADARREELAFDRIEQVMLDYGNPTAYEIELREFMRSKHLDAPRRIRAVLRLIVSADATADAAIAATAFEELSAIVPMKPVAHRYAQEAALIYHCGFGDPHKALALATELLGTAPASSNSWPDIRGIMNATLALQLTGHTESAISHLARLYSWASDWSLNTHCAQIAARISSFLLDEGDVENARSWLARARAHVLHGDINRVPAEYLTGSANLGLIDGDVAVARAMIATMSDKLPLYHAPRYSMELLAYQLRLAHAEDSSVDTGALKTLYDWHLRARALGRHDDVMQALWQTLTREGNRSLACRLLEDYLRAHRREAQSGIHQLRMGTLADPAWSVASAHLRHP